MYSILTLNLPNFLNGLVHFPILNCPLSFLGYQDENLKMVSHRYRAWSECTDVQAGLAVYWWHSLVFTSMSAVFLSTSNYISLYFLRQGRVYHSCRAILVYNHLFSNLKWLISHRIKGRYFELSQSGLFTLLIHLDNYITSVHLLSCT